MNKIAINFILALILISGCSNAQQTNYKINYISFQFVHSLRIPDHVVTVEIIKRQNEIVVKTHSEPMNKDQKWAKTKVDTTFNLDPKVFTVLANDVLILNKIDLSKAFAEGGFDGTECSIEFGTYGNTITYSFWTPDYQTERRGLTDFLRLCKKLIEIGGFKPEEIL